MSSVWRGLGTAWRICLDRRPEADVEHLVGLVEHDRIHLVEPDRMPRHQVHQSSRRGDDHLATGGQETLLGIDRLAADDRRRAAASSVGELLEFQGDLDHQLARRRQDQGLRLAFALVDLLQDRDQERGGLARPRRRVAQAVTPGDGGGEQVRLDRARLDVPDADQRRLRLLVNSQLEKPFGSQNLIRRRLQSQLLVTPNLRRGQDDPIGRPFSDAACVDVGLVAPKGSAPATSRMRKEETAQRDQRAGCSRGEISASSRWGANLQCHHQRK